MSKLLYTPVTLTAQSKKRLKVAKALGVTAAQKEKAPKGKTTPGGGLGLASCLKELSALMEGDAATRVTRRSEVVRQWLQ